MRGKQSNRGYNYDPIFEHIYRAWIYGFRFVHGVSNATMIFLAQAVQRASHRSGSITGTSFIYCPFFRPRNVACNVTPASNRWQLQFWRFAFRVLTFVRVSFERALSIY